MHQINELKEKYQAMKNLKQNVTSIAYLEEEEDEEEDDGEDEEDENLTIVDGEVQKEGGDSVLNKLTSFF